MNWKRVRLEEIAFVERGKFSARPRNDKKYYGGNIPFLQTGDVSSSNGTVTSFKQTLNEYGLSVSRLFPAGTLLVTIAANIGDVADVEFDFACPDSLVAVRPIGGNNRIWLKYLLQSKKAFFKSRATQNAQANINLQVIRPMMILLPPLSEQNAIADLLSTWDEATEKTEKLIEAKEKRFKWLLNELIGKPASEGREGWRNSELHNLTNIVKGKQLNKTDMLENGRYYVLNGGISPSGRTDEWNTEAGTITISEGGNSCGFVNFNSERFWSGGHCYSLLNLKESIHMHYLYFFLKGSESELMRLRVGSGLPNIQRKDVGQFKISQPTLSEQKHIAISLTAAQEEVDLLKKISDKYMKQKHGLMQKLLMGEWQMKVIKERTE